MVFQPGESYKVAILSSLDYMKELEILKKMGIKMDYLKLLKNYFSFLEANFSYTLEKEINENVCIAIFFINKRINRSISVVYDIRNSHIDKSIWQLKNNERDFEDRSSYIYLSNLLEINKDKTQLPKLPYNISLTDKELEDIFVPYVELLKKYALKIIKGEHWEVVPWLDSFNREFT